MSDTFKILGQEEATTAEVALYTVPVASTTSTGGVFVAPKSITLPVQALVSSLIVCGTTGGNFTVGLQTLADWTAAAPLTDKQYIFKLVPIATATTKILKLGLTLAPGDRIVIQADAPGVASITAMGIEVQ